MQVRICVRMSAECTGVGMDKCMIICMYVCIFVCMCICISYISLIAISFIPPPRFPHHSALRALPL